MSQRSIRFPDELEARVVALAEADGRTFSNWVLRAVERAIPRPISAEEREAVKVFRERTLSDLDRQVETEPPLGIRPKLPAGVKTARDLAMERQAALNKAKGS